ncbi:MAG: hypothetical protein M1832_003564 [Thelocarpon impressellum]|nr:MAG: hypothetical protein M1832_003564 [Thelocarpon impressellum]
MAIQADPPAAPKLEDIATSSEWDDEARLEAALEELKEMHIRLRELRTTIPDLVRPLTTPASSPEELFASFGAAAQTATGDVRSFIEYMRAPTARATLDRAAASRAQDGAVKAWRVTEEPGWLVRKGGEKRPAETNDAPADEGKSDVEGEGEWEGEEDVEAVVRAFRERHPSIRVDTDEGDVTTVILPAPARLIFHLSRAPPPSSDDTTPIQNLENAKAKGNYVVTCKHASKLHAAITRNVAGRSRRQSLAYLLEMLASYADIATAPCARCGCLLDARPQFPAVRRRVAFKTPDEPSEGPAPESAEKEKGETKETFVWRAFHDSCL